MNTPLPSTHLPTIAPAPLPALPRRALVAVFVWVALAATLAATGTLATALPLIPIAFVVSIGGTIIAWRRSPALRAWTSSLDLRLPILLHVTRIGFGTLFLVELAAGRLPAYFAERGGYGDILAGALAITAALAAGRPPQRRDRPRTQPPTRVGRAIVYTFSIVGLADILLVFATAQVGILVDHDTLLLNALPRLPYALLPTIVVPLVILSHLLVLQRLRATR